MLKEEQNIFGFVEGRDAYRGMRGTEWILGMVNGWYACSSMRPKAVPEEGRNSSGIGGGKGCMLEHASQRGIAGTGCMHCGRDAEADGREHIGNAYLWMLDRGTGCMLEHAYRGGVARRFINDGGQDAY
jgi:hypothetical protein